MLLEYSSKIYKSRTNLQVTYKYHTHSKRVGVIMENNFTAPACGDRHNNQTMAHLQTKINETYLEEIIPAAYQILISLSVMQDNT